MMVQIGFRDTVYEFAPVAREAEGSGTAAIHGPLVMPSLSIDPEDSALVVRLTFDEGYEVREVLARRQQVVVMATNRARHGVRRESTSLLVADDYVLARFAVPEIFVVHSDSLVYLRDARKDGALLATYGSKRLRASVYRDPSDVPVDESPRRVRDDASQASPYRRGSAARTTTTEPSEPLPPCVIRLRFPLTAGAQARLRPIVPAAATATNPSTAAPSSSSSSSLSSSSSTL